MICKRTKKNPPTEAQFSLINTIKALNPLYIKIIGKKIIVHNVIINSPNEPHPFLIFLPKAFNPSQIFIKGQAKTKPIV